MDAIQRSKRRNFFDGDRITQLEMVTFMLPSSSRAPATILHQRQHRQLHQHQPNTTPLFCCLATRNDTLAALPPRMSAESVAPSRRSSLDARSTTVSTQDCLGSIRPRVGSTLIPICRSR